MMCPPLDFMGPIQLPYCEIGISMKAEHNTWSGSRISNDESDQLLLVNSVVMHSARLDRGLTQSRWLKENSLLGPPEEEHEAEQEPKDKKRFGHGSTARGFQWVCMAGNLRQCEFQ